MKLEKKTLCSFGIFKSLATKYAWLVRQNQTKDFFQISSIPKVDALFFYASGRRLLAANVNLLSVKNTWIYWNLHLSNKMLNKLLKSESGENMIYDAHSDPKVTSSYEKFDKILVT